MIGPIARIILRYVAAALVTYGLVPLEVGAQIAVDPDLIAVLGLALGAMVEIGYALARRRGWAT
jgi:preprotein translocase subunit Sec61beta